METNPGAFSAATIAGGGRMIARCCMCKTTQGELNMTRNPFGDIHIVCKPCIPKWAIFWGEKE